MSPVEFWFDFASTYSYPAALRIEAEATRAGIPVAWRPFLLGPIFQRQGWNDSPFNLNPARGRYMWRDLERLCAQSGIPFRRPSRFPRATVLPARVALVLEEDSRFPRFMRALFRANFAEDREISEASVVGEVLTGTGFDAGAVLAAAVAEANKQRLRARVDAGWERGIFGAPTFIVEGELFWGNDRLEQALAWARSAAVGSAPGEAEG